MKVVTLEDWAPTVRVLLELAQQEADTRGHAETTPAHVLQVLLAMPPVRRLLGDAFPGVEKAAERAFLVARRSTGKTAVLDAPLARLVTGAMVERTTPVFLGACWSSTTLLERVAPTLSVHGEAFAALLDAPRLSEMLRNPVANDAVTACPYLGTAVGAASKRKHAVVTARHVALTFLEAIDKVRTKKGLPGLTDEIAAVEALIGRTAVLRREGQKTLLYEAKLVGALADALTPGEGSTARRFLDGCLEDDEAIAFVREMRSGREAAG